MSNKKTLEGEEHLRLAAKALKTGLLKWNPDYDTAGDEYSRAATAFKVAKANDRALDALTKACDCYKEMRSLYQAGKMLEQAVLLCRDMEQFDKIGGYAERGALLYRQGGNPESAAQLLEKAAKLLETKFPEEALSLYSKAAETVGCEDRPKEASDYLAKVAKLQVRTELWEDAVDTLKQTIQLHQDAGSTTTTGRLVAGLCLVHLAREDSVAASKAYNELGGYCDPDLNGAMHTILNAFEEEDAEAAKEGLNRSVIKDLDIDFSRMVRKIKLPDSGDLEAAAANFGAKRAAEMTAEKNAHPPSHSVQAVDSVVAEQKKLEEDEDELC